MPVPASEAIASDIGHGALGVRYGLRPFRDLLAETSGQRHLWVELRPKMLLATWTAEGGGVYSKAVAETFDGVVLDVVGVQTLTETLSRVESSALCVAGKFYYSGATLYIHLTADANPSGTSVVAELGVHVGSHGVHHPLFCTDRLANGGFDAWTGASPDGWSQTTGAGVALDKTTSDPLQGSYAARLTFTAATGTGELRQQFTDLAAGSIYRLSGAYRNTSATNGLRLRIYVNDTVSLFLHADGRTISSASPAVIDETAGAGEWKRFLFDFVCPSWATVRFVFNAGPVSGSQSGTVDLDDVKLQCVSRFAFFEPLLSLDSLPTIEAARADSFWGQMSSAIGNLSLLNGGGRLEPLIASYDWLGATAILRVGGRFQLGGNETLIEDCPVVASGRLGAPEVSDGGVSFDLRDDRAILQQTLPLRTYNNNGGVDAYTQPDRGRARPLLWGTKTGIRPVQYDIHYPGGGPVPMGKYELVDCTDWPTGLNWVTRVNWYADEQAAIARSTSLRVSLLGNTTEPPDISADVDLAVGRFYVLHDMRPLVITNENNKVHFDIGGGVLTAVLGIGTGPAYGLASDPAGLCLDIAGKMNTAAGTADITCDFVETTQKVRISKGAGTLNLRCATGADVQMGIWDVLGFDAAADKTGALTYNADSVFTSQAFDQTIRCDAIGFTDDASGTYTGTASAAIEKAPDIALHILRVFLKVPLSAIDLPSFVAARAVADRPCSLYIGAPRTVGDIFEELETTGDMDLVLKGGVWYCLTRDTSVPAGTPELEDADYLSFESLYAPEDFFGTVQLTYNESPDGGDAINPQFGFIGYAPHSRTEMGEAIDTTVGLRFGRPDTKRFRTCLRDAADATTNPARLQEIATQCSTKRRRFRLETKGKALLAAVGGKLVLNRTRGLDTTGAIVDLLVRIVRKRDGWGRWVSEIEAVEIV